MKKIYMIPLLLLLALGILYWIGPRLPRTELNRELPTVEVGVDSLSEYIRLREEALPVKPANESIILWSDTVGQPTPYVLLYLHGFTASHYEGYPVIPDLAREFGMNVYLPRLSGHGLMTEEPLLEMTPANLYHSAQEALVIAHKLGSKVIVAGTSTGGTLALMLAADYPHLVEALILYSPNVKIKNPLAPLLSGPWGLQISRGVHRGKYAVSDDPADSEDCKYWYCRYRVEAQVYLQQLLDMRMNRTEFQKVHQPVFLGYYYKDDDHQDQTIEVKAALKMFNELGTPQKEKVKSAFPEAEAHVIGCELTSKAWREVEQQTAEFLRRVVLKCPN